jgi:hypothetical protein
VGIKLNPNALATRPAASSEIQPHPSVYAFPSGATTSSMYPTRSGGTSIVSSVFVKLRPILATYFPGPSFMNTPARSPNDSLTSFAVSVDDSWKKHTLSVRSLDSVVPRNTNSFP